ncbi:NAD(P)-dependent oxidoreductase [Halomonas shantousis]
MHNDNKIGFLGTGIMGAPMAGRLANAGYQVKAWNRTLSKAEALVPLGVEVANTPSQVITDADVVIVMLSSGPVCDEMLLGAQSIIETMPRESLLIVMSSIPVDSARRQAEAAAARHIQYLDAPVSGGEQGAIEGKLAIMAGGEPAAFERASPVLAPLGHSVRVGPAGTGQLAKLVNQLVVASTIATVSEAMLLAERGGADPAKVREALLGGFADSTILRAHAPRMLARDFTPGGPSKWQLKDTRTAVSLAEELALDLPVASLVNQLFANLVAHGDGELDHSALFRELRRRNNLPL